jgi:hypothetical protein
MLQRLFQHAGSFFGIVKNFHSTIPARLAYTWKDGSPPQATKMMLPPDHSQVALKIDSNPVPPNVLVTRGIARVEIADGESSEYAAAAERYFDEEQGSAWVEQVRTMPA